MPLLNAAYLAIALLVMVLPTARLRLPPFVVLVAGSVVFTGLAGLSIGHASKAFGTGFSQSIAGLGLTIVAAGMISAIADGTGALGRLAIWATRRGEGAVTVILALFGTLAGAGTTPAAAFAVLSPLRQALGARAQGRAVVVLGLAVTVGHGVLLPSPVIIAAMAVLGADWLRVLIIGLPVAAITTAIGALWSHHLGRWPATGPVAVPTPQGGAAAKRTTWALLAVSVILVCLLLVQAFGDLPTEPLGGGPVRERLLGLGRPLVLLVVGVGIMLLAAWRWNATALSEQGWLGKGISGATGLVLVIGAAGGFQTLLQQTGMAELLAEQILDWRAIGLFLPFLVAAIVKSLQGSSLVAALTAAGMVVPLLGPLHLDDEGGRALATLAVGIGAVTFSHINDPHFWLVGTSARLRPWHGLALISLGTLLQGVVAIYALHIVALFVV